MKAKIDNELPENCEPLPGGAATGHASGPVLSLIFGEELGVRYSSQGASEVTLSCSLMDGEEVALKSALHQLNLDWQSVSPVVDCWLPLRDVKIIRGMAGAPSIKGQIDKEQVADCAAHASQAAGSSTHSIGSRIWGSVAKIVIDGQPLPIPKLENLVKCQKFYVETLDAFSTPDVEARRDALLRAVKLTPPIEQRLSIIGAAERCTTRDERQGGIAVLSIDVYGAQLAVCMGQHVVALADFESATKGSIALLFEVSLWLLRNGWSNTLIPHGIRILANGPGRKGLNWVVDKIDFSVSLIDNVPMSILFSQMAEVPVITASNFVTKTIRQGARA